MKNTLIIFLMSLTLASCKGTQTEGSSAKKGDEGLGGLTVPGERNYTEAELIIGKRICAALKNKREFFEKLKDQQEQIRLRGENRNCDQNIFNRAEFVVKVSNASANDLQYVAVNRINYLSDVITDQSNAIKNLCDNLSVTETISNTSLNGSSYLIINLLISNGYDRLEITKKTRDAAGNFPLVSMEGVNFFTQKSQINEKFLGTEQERIRYVACSGSKNSSYIKQNWLTAITSF